VAQASTNLAVLGSPIAHSLSPLLHRTAYELLGLDWNYEAVEIAGDGLADFVQSRDASWRGLSLTMPLKWDVMPLLDSVSALAQQTGSANTVLFAHGKRSGFNTDVYGITEAFRRHGRGSLDAVVILGGGATAASALVAAASLSASRVFVGVRTVERANHLVAIGEAQGVEVQVRALDELVQIDETIDAVISTLPNGTSLELGLDPDTVRTAALFDVAYSPWPTTLVSAWRGDDVISGLEMLVLQALAQVRIFVNGDQDKALDDEENLLAAMFASVGL
jgi:shikimate dehydrogenase